MDITLDFDESLNKTTASKMDTSQESQSDAEKVDETSPNNKGGEDAESNSGDDSSSSEESGKEDKEEQSEEKNKSAGKEEENVTFLVSKIKQGLFSRSVNVLL